MNILIATFEDKESGGVSSVIGNLAEYLQKRGHEILFLYPGSSSRARKMTSKRGFIGFELNLQLPLSESRHPIFTLGAFLIHFPLGLYQLIRLIKMHRIQVVNIHYPCEYFFYFALCRRILSIALVTSVHGADLFPGGKPMARYSRAMQLLLTASDRIVAPSRSFQKDVLDVFPEIKDKTIFIHNSVDLTELNGVAADGGGAHVDPYILCIAMHNEKKGLDVLLHAFAQVCATEPSLKLVLVGDGPLREILEQLASSLGIRAKVEFLGWQGRAQIKQQLIGCQLLVLPSRSEPFGIVILEAMACGKPVVATTAGGIPEIIENGTNGILVPPDHPEALGEALNRILSDRDLRRAVAAAGYATVHERYSAEKTGAAYEALFSDLLG